jgi:hypothetical protein
MKRTALFPLLLVTACVSPNPAKVVPTPAVGTAACDGLDETTCRAAAGCHANYVDQAIDDVSVFTFDTCSGPAPADDGGCWFLDEAPCATHDDCVTVHKIDPDGSVYFADCEDEGSQPPGGGSGDPVDAGTDGGDPPADAATPCDVDAGP